MTADLAVNIILAIPIATIVLGLIGWAIATQRDDDGVAFFTWARPAPRRLARRGPGAAGADRRRQRGRRLGLSGRRARDRQR